MSEKEIRQDERRKILEKILEETACLKFELQAEDLPKIFSIQKETIEKMCKDVFTKSQKQQMAFSKRRNLLAENILSGKSAAELANITLLPEEAIAYTIEHLGEDLTGRLRHLNTDTFVLEDLGELLIDGMGGIEAYDEYIENTSF